MKFAIYARYSSSSQRAASIPEQIKVCKEYAERNKYDGKQGKQYFYYTCNGRKSGTCKKKRVNKHYIEDIVISEYRRLLSDENIKRIAKEIAVISEEEKDTTNLKHLRRLLAENKRKQKNTLSAIMERDIESVRNDKPNFLRGY